MKSGVLNNCRITELSNGLTVITEHIPYVQSFALGFWLKVGSRDETPATNGIAHFTEHMLFKGTKNRTSKQIADEIESLGGYLNAFTTKEYTCYYGRGLTHNLEKTFDVLSDMIQNSLFLNKDIEREARVIIDELKDIEDSPEELIFDKLESFLFKNTPLGLPIIGNQKNIEKFRHEDFVQFLNNRYLSNKLFIVASGNLKHEELLRFTEKYFTKNFTQKEKSLQRVKPAQPSDYFVYKEIRQSHFILATPTVGLVHKDRKKVNLISHVLGEGSSSRLFQELREKNGIAYQVNTFLNSFEDVSTFGVYFSTNDGNWEKARDLIFGEFEKLKEKKIDEIELRRAKEYLKGSYLMSLESLTNRMQRIANSFIYFNRLKSIEESIREIDEITPDDILNTANELLVKENFSTVILSSKNLLIHSAA